MKFTTACIAAVAAFTLTPGANANWFSCNNQCGAQKNIGKGLCVQGNYPKAQEMCNVNVAQTYKRCKQKCASRRLRGDAIAANLVDVYRGSMLHRPSDMFDQGLVPDKKRCLEAMAHVCPGEQKKGMVCQACIQEHSDQLRSLCAHTQSGREFCWNNDEPDDDDDLVGTFRQLARKRRLRKQKLSSTMKKCLLRNVHKMGKCKMEFRCNQASSDCIHVKCHGDVDLAGLKACEPRPVRSVSVHVPFGIIHI
mgnify:FL=1